MCGIRLPYSLIEEVCPRAGSVGDRRAAAIVINVDHLSDAIAAGAAAGEKKGSGYPAAIGVPDYEVAWSVDLVAGRVTDGCVVLDPVLDRCIVGMNSHRAAFDHGVAFDEVTFPGKVNPSALGRKLCVPCAVVIQDGGTAGHGNSVAAVEVGRAVLHEAVCPSDNTSPVGSGSIGRRPVARRRASDHTAVAAGIDSSRFIAGKRVIAGIAVTHLGAESDQYPSFSLVTANGAFFYRAEILGLDAGACIIVRDTVSHERAVVGVDTGAEGRAAGACR